MIAAVIDVNVLVSAVLGPLGFSRRIVTAWEAEEFSLITAAGIVANVAAKLRLPRITRRFRITEEDRRWVVGLLQTQARMVLVPPRECAVVTGDPEDDYVLATGRLGQAQYLVTGDRGLLALGEYAGMRIVTPRQFIELLRAIQDN